MSVVIERRNGRSSPEEPQRETQGEIQREIQNGGIPDGGGLIPAPGGGPSTALLLQRAQHSLLSARDNFERIRVRDEAHALMEAARILQKKELAIQASKLMMDAERVIAKANPALTPQESGSRGGKVSGGHNRGTQETEEASGSTDGGSGEEARTENQDDQNDQGAVGELLLEEDPPSISPESIIEKKVIRAARSIHSRLSDEEYERAFRQSQEKNDLFTRSQLRKFTQKSDQKPTPGKEHSQRPALRIQHPDRLRTLVSSPEELPSNGELSPVDSPVDFLVSFLGSGSTGRDLISPLVRLARTPFLRSGGILALITSPGHLPDLLRRLDDPEETSSEGPDSTDLLLYRWTVCLHGEGPPFPVHGDGLSVRSRWSPVVIAQKIPRKVSQEDRENGDNNLPTFSDFLAVPPIRVRDPNAFLDSVLPVAALLRRFIPGKLLRGETPPVLCDPVVGDGTVPLAALSVGCRVLASSPRQRDIDELRKWIRELSPEESEKTEESTGKKPGEESSRETDPS